MGNTPDDHGRAEQRRAQCPECGCQEINGLDCRGMFETLLAWEWQDPELLDVHFFTVSSYLLQHAASLTEEAASGLRTVFAQVLRGEATVAQVRARHGRAFEGDTRVRRPTNEVLPNLRTWSMTVADVYAGGQTGAAGRVTVWARAICTEIT